MKKTFLYSIVFLGSFFINLTYVFSTECISGDCRDGYGIMVFDDGSYYEGDWRNGKMDGKGSYIYKDGQKYIGSWKSGEINGQGEFSEYQPYLYGLKFQSRLSF